MKKKVDAKTVLKIMESIKTGNQIREAISKDFYIKEFGGSSDKRFQAVRIKPKANNPSRNNFVVEGPIGTLKDVLLYLKSKYPYDKYELHGYASAWAGKEDKLVSLSDL
jgi:hypothetical protein